MCMYGVEPECSDGHPLQTPPVGKLLDVPRMLACVEVKPSACCCAGAQQQFPFDSFEEGSFV